MSCAGYQLYGLKVLQIYKSWGRVWWSSTNLRALCTALTLSSKIRVLPIIEVKDGFCINRVHKVLIIIVSLDVANTLIMVLNNGRQLTGVHVKLFNQRGITLTLTGSSRMFNFILSNLMLLLGSEPVVLIRRIIGLGDMGTSVVHVLGQD